GSLANGVYGISNNGYGVRGNSTLGAGVYGSSSSGDGVSGYSTGANGVTGQTNSATGYGVYGFATITNGIGIRGYSIFSGYAGYFQGNVQVTGNLSKGGGSFKIDDPLDPANKYLYHSFVESPDMMNIYNGNVTTDSKGDATITLPDYFEALNRD